MPIFTLPFEELCDDARERTDRAGDPSCGNDVLARWVNQAARESRMFAARMRPDDYTKASATFSVSSGNTVTIASTGSPDGTVSDFLALRRLDITLDNGAHWRPLKPFRFSRGWATGNLSYRLRGKVLELLPVELATAYPMRMLYITRPPQMPETDSIDLAPGEDDYIAEHVAAKIRAKFEEDPLLHLAAKKAALETMQRWLVINGQGPADPVLEASPDEDPEGF